MDLRTFSLNTLRAFEASARHLSFTHAADELCVTQAAVSHQVKALEMHLGKTLFRRTTRGIVLTDEGTVLAPVVRDALNRISGALAAVSGEGVREVVTAGVVGTFAAGFLLERLPHFHASHPEIEVRVMTHNNAIDLWTESLDCAIRYGDGAWHGVRADLLMRAPLAPLCSPAMAASLQSPADLAHCVLLRSYRQRDWPGWFAAARAREFPAAGPMFDASHLMALAAMRGLGVALLPVAMFQREIAARQLVQPFAATFEAGAYWLTTLGSKERGPGLERFVEWLGQECSDGA
jgi:LysR family transcriptional regulator of beta-lactamase